MIRAMHRCAPLLLVAIMIGCAPVSGPASARPVTASNEVVYTCETDADCSVKDIGNCCGYYPACVNKDSPTFPQRVQADCSKNNTAGVCGFPDITGCTCVARRCTNKIQSADEG
jgi:hypothetical protein